MADFKELLSLAAIGKGVGKNKYQDMFASAASGVGKPTDKQGNPQEVQWDDKVYDPVITHLGYDPADRQTRYKVIDYLRQNKMMPGELLQQTTFRGRPDKQKIGSIRSIIDNYDAFTTDTVM